MGASLSYYAHGTPSIDKPEEPVLGLLQYTKEVQRNEE
jgi:hypothetical protein